MNITRFVVSLMCALVVLSAGAAAGSRASDENQQKDEDVVIEIHHCTTCGFRTQATKLAAEIKKELGYESTLVVGKVGSFDVFVNGTLLFSKKKTGRFPNPGEVVQLIEDFLDKVEKDRQ
jgi:selenoprotein W-related protein